MIKPYIFQKCKFCHGDSFAFIAGYHLVEGDSQKLIASDYECITCQNITRTFEPINYNLHQIIVKSVFSFKVYSKEEILFMETFLNIHIPYKNIFLVKCFILYHLWRKWL